MDFKRNSKSVKSVCLEKIRDKNPDKTIIIVLDKFKSHWAKTKELGMVPVYSHE